MAESCFGSISRVKGNSGREGFVLDLGVSALPATTNVFKRSGLERLNLLGVNVETWSHAVGVHGKKGPPDFER